MSTNTINLFTWGTTFDSTVVIDDCVYPNRYNITLGFLPKSKNIQDQNIGFERFKYLFNTLCENAIIYSPQDKTMPYWFKMPVNKILLPGNPYDQLLGTILFEKLNSICGNFFHLGYLTVDSKLGDNIKYTIDNESVKTIEHDTSFWDDEKIKTWWHRDDTATFDQRINSKTIWTGAVTWKDLGYETNSVKKQNFNPTVIDGGRKE